MLGLETVAQGGRDDPADLTGYGDAHAGVVDLAGLARGVEGVSLAPAPPAKKALAPRPKWPWIATAAVLLLIA